MLTRFFVLIFALSLCASQGPLIEYGNDSFPDLRIRLPRKETLTLVGFQWGAPSSFNPFNGWPAWPTRPEFNLMYEPLITYNSLSGKVEPLLGQFYKSDNDVVEIMLNPKAKWSDGTPLTAADVLFSYTLSINDFQSPCNFIKGYIKEVTSRKEGDREVVIFHVDKEKQNNPMAVLNHLTYCPIYPKHIFESKIKNGGGIYAVETDMMMQPQVVSGPYNYYKHNEEVIVIERRDDYWGNEALYGGKKAAPRFIAHPIFKAWEDSKTALEHGGLDLSSNYIPEVWKLHSKGVKTWYKKAPYYRPGSTPMFIINCSDSKKALSDARFRRAIALAINYDKINEKAVSNYSPKLKSGLILPYGPESRFYNAKEVEKYGSSKYSPDAATALLAECGYDFVKKDGKIVSASWNNIPQQPITLTCPAGWTDFTDIINAAVDDLNAVGIYAKVNFVTYPEYMTAKNLGTFDLYLDTPTPLFDVTMPYNRFEPILSSAKWKPVGEKMYVNTGRFNNPNSPHYIAAVDSLLRIAPLEQDAQKLLDIYTKLNRIYMEQQPTIPVCYRPEEFYTFSEKYWTGFPTESNSYAPPRMPVSGVARNTLWELKSVAPVAKTSGGTSKDSSDKKPWWNPKK